MSKQVFHFLPIELPFYEVLPGESRRVLGDPADRKIQFLIFGTSEQGVPDMFWPPGDADLLVLPIENCRRQMFSARKFIITSSVPANLQKILAVYAKPFAENGRRYRFWIFHLAYRFYLTNLAYSLL